MYPRIITLSGEMSTGKSSIAGALLDLLPGWQRVNTGQRFREFTSARGLSIQQVSHLPDEVHREFDALQMELLQNGSQMIVEGRLAGWLARDLPDVFRVFCFTAMEVRVQRYMERDHVGWDEAFSDIEYRDTRDVEKFKNMYGVADYRSPDFYHLRLDTSSQSPLELARRLLHAARLEAETLPENIRKGENRA